MSSKVLFRFMFTSFLLSAAGCASVSSTSGSKVPAMLVAETILNINGVDYKLDSYIKPFQQPYYVSVSRVDGKPITRDVATKVAKEYIKPRGCTQSLKLDSNLDQSNADNSKWIIGILC